MKTDKLIALIAIVVTALLVAWVASRFVAP